MPCAESSTICARRQVTTDPVPRRTMRNSRIPSSLLIGRTCTGWTIAHLLQGSQDQTRQGCAAQRSAGSPYRPPNRAKAGGRGTSSTTFSFAFFPGVGAGLDVAPAALSGLLAANPAIAASPPAPTSTERRLNRRDSETAVVVGSHRVHNFRPSFSRIGKTDWRTLPRIVASMSAKDKHFSPEL